MHDEEFEAYSVHVDRYPVLRMTVDDFLDEAREMGLLPPLTRDDFADDPSRETWLRKSRPVRLAFYDLLIDGLGDDFLPLAGRPLSRGGLKCGSSASIR